MITKKFFIKTFGCQMNKKDSSVIARILNENGYKQTSNFGLADVFVVNTCSVREHAEKRALGYIAGLKAWRSERKRVIAVVGCMAQRLADTIVTKFPFVDLILGPDSYRKIGCFTNQIFSEPTKIIETSLSDETYCGIYATMHSVTDYVSIMRGCSNFCSYCIVPYVRGRARSRPKDDIAKEIDNLVKNGVKDITLLGQNVNEYSYGETNFAGLLNLLGRVRGLFRLRFLTSHPKDLDDAVIEAVRKSSTICEWFHLPLQSGNNRILQLMNRMYTKEDYLRLISKIREKIPEAAITTDVIVGFPSETDKEFEETIKVMSEVKFDDAYMYRYSPREGTKAYGYDTLPETVIKVRLNRLITLQRKIILEKTESMIGKKFEVLFEGRAKNGATRGTSRRNKSIIVEQEIAPGEVRDVIIEKVKGSTPIGVLI